MLLVTNSVQTSLTTLSSLTLPCLSCPPQHRQLHTATCCTAHNSTPQHTTLHCLATMSQMHLSEGPNNRCIVFWRITQMPLYTSDFILPPCLCFLHRCKFPFTSSSDSYVWDSNFIPFWLNSRYFFPSIFFSHFYYLNSSVVYLNIKWVFTSRVFFKMPKCFALFFLKKFFFWIWFW